MTLPNGYHFPDVSKYRTVCNWDGYSGYPISACKKSEGRTYQDPSFESWYQSMLSHRLFPMPYHFLRGEYSVSEQVSNYLEGLQLPFGVMLDIETSGIGSNPTITQASEFLSMVQKETGIPRKFMTYYMPRWWYNAYGKGSNALADAILWNSHYSTSPNMLPFAGDSIEILQYSSSAPINGLCPPGTGDMNIAVDMTIKEFLSRIMYIPTEPIDLEDPDMPFEMRDVESNPQRVRAVIGGSLIGYESNAHRAELQASFRAAGIEFPEVLVNAYWFDRIYKSGAASLAHEDMTHSETMEAIAELPGGTTALTPADLEAIRLIVDAELDKRTLAD